MSYYTLDGEYCIEYEIKHSLFIAYVKGISDYEDGLRFVAEKKKKHSDATHNCYAIVCVSNEQKFSDDGEPQGTAGMPILQVLKKNNLNNVACVVTRYFGGIKLGAGGLVASYTKSAVMAVEGAVKIEKKESEIYTFSLPYTDLTTVNRVLALSKGKCVETSYGETIKLIVAVPKENVSSFIDGINEILGGKNSPVYMYERYESY